MQIDLGEDEQPEISLIALIDCIFFVLLFFMVATSFRQDDKPGEDKRLAITLPQSQVSLQATGSAAAALVIGIDAKGELYWDHQPVTTAELRERLHAAAQADRQRPVRIDGDSQVAYQQIVHLLDLCQFEGLGQVSLKTRNNR